MEDQATDRLTPSPRGGGVNLLYSRAPTLFPWPLSTETLRLGHNSNGADKQHSQTLLLFLYLPSGPGSLQKTFNLTDI